MWFVCLVFLWLLINYYFYQQIIYNLTMRILRIILKVIRNINYRLFRYKRVTLNSIANGRKLNLMCHVWVCHVCDDITFVTIISLIDFSLTVSTSSIGYGNCSFFLCATLKVLLWFLFGDFGNLFATRWLWFGRSEEQVMGYRRKFRCEKEEAKTRRTMI